MIFSISFKVYGGDGAPCCAKMQLMPRLQLWDSEWGSDAM